MGNPKQSSRVDAVVDFFGPTDFLKREDVIPAACNGELENPDADTSPESVLLGCPMSSCRSISTNSPESGGVFRQALNWKDAISTLTICL